MASLHASNPQPPVALITGAGSGIGRAIAQQLAALTYRLALVGRRLGPLDETARSLKTESLRIPADAGDCAQIAGAIDRTVAHFGRLDALVNNAGHAPLLPIDQTTPELLDEVFRINAIGPAYAIARAWPIFTRQRPEGGCIINISSMATADPFPGFFMYAAAKAGVNLMAKSCASEGREFNIRAFSIAPGAVETRMLRALFPESQLPRSSTLAPDDVARVAVECITGARDNQNGETIYLPSP